MTNVHHVIIGCFSVVKATRYSKPHRETYLHIRKMQMLHGPYMLSNQSICVSCLEDSKKVNRQQMRLLSANKTNHSMLFWQKNGCDQAYATSHLKTFFFVAPLSIALNI